MAQDAIALNDHHGFAAMKEMIAKRAGGGYEPELVDLFLTSAEKLLAGLEGPVDRATILALEPEPHSMLDEEACEEAYLAIADMIDMRMPFTFGHSRAVASLAAAAVKEGRLCPDAVEAVLTAAGQLARRTTGARLAGLTPREIEVLRLIAAGDTAKEAARKLDIAPKTADNHIQSLYSKISVTTRAGAALFALEQGLVA
jgi:DNA-binding CsgD family transcriptional regulator